VSSVACIARDMRYGNNSRVESKSLGGSIVTIYPCKAMDICKFRHPPSALENDTGDGDDVLEQF